MAENQFDIIIVGAGPAGSAAALYAVRKNLRTLLLEKDRFPRDKICGDAISGKAMSILDDLDLVQETKNLPGRPVKSILISSPANNKTYIQLKDNEIKRIPAGMLIKRKIFDTFLFEKAKAAVHTCLENFKITGLITEKGIVKGVCGGGNGQLQKTFYAPLVLGADGFNSIVARKTGNYHLNSRHWVTALRQYYSGVLGLDNQLEIHFIKEAQPGYFWIFPLDKDHANIGVGMVHKFIKRKKVDLKKILENVKENPAIKERFINAKPMENPRGWNLPLASTHRKNHGDGYLLLGDAAGLIDPFSGEGIGNALYSAKFAIETAVQAHKADNYSESFLKKYDSLLWGKLANEFKTSTKLQKIGRIQPLLNFIIGKAQRNKEVEDILSAMMRQEVPKKQLTSPLFYLKLLLN